jgi:hypothetical protein
VTRNLTEFAPPELPMKAGHSNVRSDLKDSSVDHFESIRNQEIMLCEDGRNNSSLSKREQRKKSNWKFSTNRESPAAAPLTSTKQN